MRPTRRARVALDVMVEALELLAVFALLFTVLAWVYAVAGPWLRGER